MLDTCCALFLRSTVLLLCTAGLAGCSGSAEEIPELAPVSGTVTLDGEPLAGVNVIFSPRGQTGGTGAAGVTDSAGRYTLRHRSNEPGVEPGTYAVTFSKIAMPDGAPIPEGKDAADVGAVQVLPDRYTDPAAAPESHVVTVPKEGTTRDFELTSR